MPPSTTTTTSDKSEPYTTEELRRLLSDIDTERHQLQDTIEMPLTKQANKFNEKQVQELQELLSILKTDFKERWWKADDLCRNRRRAENELREKREDDKKKQKENDNETWSE